MKLRWIPAALLLTLAAAAGAGDPFPPATPERWALPNPDLFDVATLGSRAWAVGSWGSVLRSDDAGASWRPLRTPTTRTLFAVSFADERHGWAVGATGVIVRTTDAGETWRPQTAARLDPLGGGELPLDSHLLGVSAVGPSEAWAVGDFGIVLHTADGERWQPVSIPPEIFTDGNTPERIWNAVHFADARRGWIAGEFGTVLRTEDGGATWLGPAELRGVDRELYLFGIAERGGTLAVSGLAGRVLVSEDGGASFESRSIETSAGLFAVEIDASHAIAAGDRGVLYHSTDAGRTWRSPGRPRQFNWLTGVTALDHGVVLAVGEKGLVLRSTDGGETFGRITGAEPPPESAVSVPDVHTPRRRDEMPNHEKRS